jgi:hypothetical protein
MVPNRPPKTVAEVYSAHAAMKYFTPELLTRFGSPDDRVADAAQAEWEAATAKYQKHFRSIERQLPKRLRGLLRRYSLHDATVSFAGVADEVIDLTLKLDTPPRETVFLRYRLVSDVQMVAHVVPGHDTTQVLSWLYDEIDIAGEGVFPIIEQRILFSTGLELTIQFQDLSYSTARTLPLIANGATGPVRVETAG